MPLLIKIKLRAVQKKSITSLIPILYIDNKNASNANCISYQHRETKSRIGYLPFGLYHRTNHIKISQTEREVHSRLLVYTRP